MRGAGEMSPAGGGGAHGVAEELHQLEQKQKHGENIRADDKRDIVSKHNIPNLSSPSTSRQQAGEADSINDEVLQSDRRGSSPSSPSLQQTTDDRSLEKNKSSRKSSPSKKSKLSAEETKESADKNKQDREIVIGNFHAYESDEQTAELLPRLVNGCSRVILPVETEKPSQDERGQYKQAKKKYQNNYNRCDPYDVPPDYRCGIGGMFGCCQPWAHKTSFLAVFCATTVLQGMFYTYFVSSLTTIQKLFGVSSQVTGIIMSATEVGQIVASLFLAFYGGSGHRPRWLGWGVLLFTFCTFLCAVPHFIFSYYETGAQYSQSVHTSSDTLSDMNTCSLPLAKNPSSDNSTSFLDGEEPSCDNSTYLTNVVLGIFFVALIGVGVGNTAVQNLGIPYIDDNVDNKDSAMYIATTSGVRILGPTFGFVLGSMCHRVYLHPGHPPEGIDSNDPRWVGAWWLGHIIVSALMLVQSFILFLFPRRLPPKRIRLNASNGGLASLEAPFSVSTTATSIASTAGAEGGRVRTNLTALMRPDSAPSSRHPSSNNLQQAADTSLMQQAAGADTSLLHQASAVEAGVCVSDTDSHETPKFKDFPRAVKRQLQNKVLILRTCSSVLHILPIAGLYTFLPKYLETQFRLPVHTAAMVSGIGGIMLMLVGVIISGAVIRIYHPPTKAVSAWIAFTALAYCCGMVIMIFIGCNEQDIKGLKLNNEQYQFVPLCNRTCQCDEALYAPVCTTDGTTHYSACHLGCTAVFDDFINNSGADHNKSAPVQFSACECLDDPDAVVDLKRCDLNCNNVYWYIGVFAIFVVIHSSGEVGGILITLRCVDKKDKAMALGIVNMAIALLANTPCPILYGGLVDASCVLWQTTCGTTGHCLLYDTEYFRTVFHGITAAVMFFAFICDVAVFFNSKHIELVPGSKLDNDNFELNEDSTSSGHNYEESHGHKVVASSPPRLVEKLNKNDHPMHDQNKQLQDNLQQQNSQQKPKDGSISVSPIAQEKTSTRVSSPSPLKMTPKRASSELPSDGVRNQHGLHKSPAEYVVTSPKGSQNSSISGTNVSGGNKNKIVANNSDRNNTPSSSSSGGKYPSKNTTESIVIGISDSGEVGKGRDAIVNQTSPPDGATSTPAGPRQPYMSTAL